MQRQRLISNKILQSILLAVFALLGYVMGSIYILDEQTREEALTQTPYVLLAGMLLLLLYARTPFNIKTISIFTSIAVSSYIIEAIGVKTGFIFGHYVYGSNFGIQLFNTPLLIGVNWLYLVCASAAVARQITPDPNRQLLWAALLMVGYDFLLEQAAPKMGLWSWQDSQPPLQNFLAWFLLALGYQWLLKKYQIDTRNNLALPLLILQVSLFALVILFIP